MIMSILHSHVLHIHSISLSFCCVHGVKKITKEMREGNGVRKGRKGKGKGRRGKGEKRRGKGGERKVGG